MILISSPYSHPDVTIKMERVKKIAIFVDAEIKKSNLVFSPVLYGLKVLQYAVSYTHLTLPTILRV